MTQVARSEPFLKLSALRAFRAVFGMFCASRSPSVALVLEACARGIYSVAQNDEVDYGTKRTPKYKKKSLLRRNPFYQLKSNRLSPKHNPQTAN